MNVRVNGAYVYFEIPIFGGIPITQTTVSSLTVTLLLCFCFLYFGRNLKKRPDGKQVLVEKGVSMLYNMVCDTMGQHNTHYLPLIGTIFLSSIFSSLIGMTGFLRSATADLSVPLEAMRFSTMDETMLRAAYRMLVMTPPPATLPK